MTLEEPPSGGNTMVEPRSGGAPLPLSGSTSAPRPSYQMSPKDRAEIVEKIRKVVFQILFGLENATSAVTGFVDRLKKQDKDFDEHLGMFVGAVLTLFGGQFATTFAFVEAFQQTGWESLMENGRIILEQLRNAKNAIQEDDLVDDNRDGVADVSVLPADQLAARKFNVFLSSVDPDVFHKALSAMWLGFLSASAAVKLKFANVIALGASLGEFIEKPAQKYLLPRLRESLDARYHKWLPSVIGYVSRMIGVSVAFRLNRVLATISTAVRGGDMLLSNFALLCRKRGMEFLTKGPVDEMVAFSVVAAGIYAQLFGPQSSFLVRLALFPLAITEQILTLWVGAK